MSKDKEDAELIVHRCMARIAGFIWKMGGCTENRGEEHRRSKIEDVPVVLQKLRELGLGVKELLLTRARVNVGKDADNHGIQPLRPIGVAKRVWKEA